MSKIKVGNKNNSFLNGEWAAHVSRFMKRLTSHKRRAESKNIIHKLLK